MACFHGNPREVRVRWSTQEPFPNKYSFIVPLSVFSGIKRKCGFNQERQTEQTSGRTSRPELRGELIALSLPPFMRLPSLSLGFYLQYVNCVWKMKVKPSWSSFLWPHKTRCEWAPGLGSYITDPHLAFEMGLWSNCNPSKKRLKCKNPLTAFSSYQFGSSNNIFSAVLNLL